MEKFETPEGCIAIDEQGGWEGRAAPLDSLRKTAELFNLRGGKTIVEIGTGLHGKMSGNSILVWVRETSAKRIIAVDRNQERIDQVAESVGDDRRVETVLADGIGFLRGFSSPVDLLYLDFWFPDQPDTLRGTGRVEAYRDAFAAADSKLGSGSMILIDDTDHVDPWKQTHIVPMARASGFRVVYVGRQTLLLRE